MPKFISNIGPKVHFPSKLCKIYENAKMSQSIGKKQNGTGKMKEQKKQMFKREKIFFKN
jgi:hypothetical protein